MSTTDDQQPPGSSPGLEPPAADRLLVADSFRVRVDRGETQVRGFERHLRRFESGVRDRVAGDDVLADDLDDRLDIFLQRSSERIVAYGEGFPRLECVAYSDGSVHFRLSLRPLPPLGEAIALKRAPHARLRHAGIKGPNIAHYARLRQALGAEPLLTDGDGFVTETATTSLIWWDSHDPEAPGATVPTDSPAARVPSVTESLLREIAERLGTKLASARITPEELAEREVWAVNALHGIRPVESLDGVRLSAPNPARLAAFNAALDQTWEPVRRGAAPST